MQPRLWSCPNNDVLCTPVLLGSSLKAHVWDQFHYRRSEVREGDKDTVSCCLHSQSQPDILQDTWTEGGGCAAWVGPPPAFLKGNYRFDRVNAPQPDEHKWLVVAALTNTGAVPNSPEWHVELFCKFCSFMVHQWGATGSTCPGGKSDNWTHFRFEFGQKVSSDLMRRVFSVNLYSPGHERSCVDLQRWMAAAGRTYLSFRFAMNSSIDTLSKSTKSAFPNSRLSCSAMTRPVSSWSACRNEVNGWLWSADGRWTLAGSSSASSPQWTAASSMRIVRAEKVKVWFHSWPWTWRVWSLDVMRNVFLSKLLLFCWKEKKIPTPPHVRTLSSGGRQTWSRYTVCQLRPFSWSLSPVVRTHRPPIALQPPLRAPPPPCPGHAPGLWRGVGQTLAPGPHSWGDRSSLCLSHTSAMTGPPPPGTGAPGPLPFLCYHKRKNEGSEFTWWDVNEWRYWEWSCRDLQPSVSPPLHRGLLSEIPPTHRHRSATRLTLVLLRHLVSNRGKCLSDLELLSLILYISYKTDKTRKSGSADFLLNM